MGSSGDRPHPAFGLQRRRDYGAGEGGLARVYGDAEEGEHHDDEGGAVELSEEAMKRADIEVAEV